MAYIRDNGLFIGRDLRSFLNEMIFNETTDYYSVIRLRNREQFNSYIGFSQLNILLQDKTRGTGIKTLLYCIDADTEKTEEATKYTGFVVDMDGKNVITYGDFSCTFSDFNLKIEGAVLPDIVNTKRLAKTWRRNIYLHLDKEKQEQYKQDCAKELIEQEFEFDKN